MFLLSRFLLVSCSAFWINYRLVTPLLTPIFCKKNFTVGEFRLISRFQIFLVGCSRAATNDHTNLFSENFGSYNFVFQQNIPSNGKFWTHIETKYRIFSIFFFSEMKSGKRLEIKFTTNGMQFDKHKNLVFTDITCLNS